MDTRTLTCINCPLGCAVTVTLEDGEIRSVTGNTCKRGAVYARQEVAAPVRTVTTTLPVQGGVWPTVPVKTARPIPKDRILDCVRSLRSMTLAAPVRLGQTVAQFEGVALVSAGEVPIQSCEAARS